jgi:hypothetical protein
MYDSMTPPNSRRTEALSCIRWGKARDGTLSEITDVQYTVIPQYIHEFTIHKVSRTILYGRSQVFFQKSPIGHLHELLSGGSEEVAKKENSNRPTQLNRSVHAHECPWSYWWSSEERVLRNTGMYVASVVQWLVFLVQIQRSITGTTRFSEN